MSINIDVLASLKWVLGIKKNACSIRSRDGECLVMTQTIQENVTSTSTLGKSGHDSLFWNVLRSTLYSSLKIMSDCESL